MNSSWRETSGDRGVVRGVDSAKALKLEALIGCIEFRVEERKEGHGACMGVVVGPWDSPAVRARVADASGRPQAT